MIDGLVGWSLELEDVQVGPQARVPRRWPYFHSQFQRSKSKLLQQVAPKTDKYMVPAQVFTTRLYKDLWSLGRNRMSPNLSVRRVVALECARLIWHGLVELSNCRLPCSS